MKVQVPLAPNQPLYELRLVYRQTLLTAEPPGIFGRM